MAWSEKYTESSFQQDRLPEDNTAGKEINYRANIVIQGGHDDEKTFRFKAVKMKTELLAVGMRERGVARMTSTSQCG